MFHVEHFTVTFVFTKYYVNWRQMKRKKGLRRRGERGGKVGNLRASAGAGRRSTAEREWLREWREGRQELERWRKVPKKRVTLNLDADVLAWFRGKGRGYQWEINKALRRAMEEEWKGLE